jgi:hypothetical protein
MATFKHLLAASRVGRTDTEAAAECGGGDSLREFLEELALLSAAWTGFPLFPRSSRFDEHEGKEKQ